MRLLNQGHHYVSGNSIGLLVFLFCLASGASYGVISREFSTPKTIVCWIIHKVPEVLISVLGRDIVCQQQRTINRKLALVVPTFPGEPGNWGRARELRDITSILKPQENQTLGVTETGSYLLQFNNKPLVLTRPGFWIFVLAFLVQSMTPETPEPWSTAYNTGKISVLQRLIFNNPLQWNLDITILC